MKRQQTWGGIGPFLRPLAGLSVLSIGLYAVEALRTGTGRDWYLIWNLFLAWLPVLLAGGWSQVLRGHVWSSWGSLLLAGLWLIFLPNSFYIVTDFIHLPDAHHTDLLATAVTYTGFALTGLLAGLLSLAVVQRELQRLFSVQTVRLVLIGIIGLASFAIYLGRDLRWNSWDILFDPAGILFDVSDRIVDPASHPQAVVISLLFFVLIGSLHLAAGSFVRALRALPKK